MEIEANEIEFLQKKVIKQLEEDFNPKYIKKKLLDCLHEAGIPERNIQVKLFPFEKHEKNKKKTALGWYVSNSQFKSAATMYYSVKNIVDALSEIEALNIENYNTVKERVHDVIMDTICHEYGHVIEEIVHFNNRRKFQDSEQDKKLKAEQIYLKFYESFDTHERFPANEVFAETFGVSLSNGYPLDEVEGLQDVIDYYNEEIFYDIDLIWVKQPKYLRQLDLLFINDKAIGKFYEDGIGYLGMSKHACERLIKVAQSKLPEVQVELVKCSLPKNLELLGCDEVRFPQYVHYVVKAKNPMSQDYRFFDLMPEQSFGKAYMAEEELNELWGKTENFSADVKVEKKSRLKMR